MGRVNLRTVLGTCTESSTRSFPEMSYREGTGPTSFAPPSCSSMRPWKT